MMKILMVCLGNICRSPMAEGVMKQVAEDHGLAHVFVDSCGFESYHLGDAPDKRAVKACKNHQIDISNQRQRLFKVSDFDVFDYIFVMDSNNYNDVRRMARNEQDMKKVDYLLNVVYPNSNKAVPDPYYGSDDGFENAFLLIEKACKQFAKEKLMVQQKKD